MLLQGQKFLNYIFNNLRQIKAFQYYLISAVEIKINENSWMKRATDVMLFCALEYLILPKSRLPLNQQLMKSGEAEIVEVSEIFYNVIKQFDDQQALDPQDLPNFKKNHVKLLYPHKDDPQGVRKYFCCEACCESPGYFCCCTSSNPGGEFIKFGLSICLYFKFLKHSIIFYVFLSMLAVLSCVVCYKVASQNAINPLDGYSNFLFSTTYGVFSSEHNKCRYSLLTPSLGIYQASFDLQCPSGTLRVFDSVLSKQSLNSLYNCRNERKKQENGDSSTSKYRLTSQKTCNSDDSSCTIKQTYNTLVANTSFTTVAYTYQCLNNHYQVGAIDQQSRYFLYFIVAVDIFICLSFMLFLRSEIGAEKDQTAYFKGTQASLDDFSVKIKGFTTNTAEDEFEALVKTLQQIYTKQDLTKSIVSFTFPENEEMLAYYRDKFEIFSEVTALIKEYYFADAAHRDLPFKECHQRVFEKEGGDLRFQEYAFRLQKLIQAVISSESKKYQIQKSSADKVSLLLVFDTVNRKQMIKSLIRERCCSKNEIWVGNKTYTIEPAPVPDMILWENKYSWTKLRVFISWIFTIAICVGSYLLFGFIQYKQSLLFTSYNYGIDCAVLFTPAQLSVVNSALLSQANYVTCICKDQGLLSTSSENSSYCSTWSTQYRLYLIVPLLISLGIVVYNVVVSYLFRWMGYFERHKFVIDEELSFTLKRAFLLVMNMGLIMILLNYNYNGETDLTTVSFIFLGKYDDFSADWYQSIGSIIVLTLIFNIATPIAEFILSFILKCLRKCWDTRCYRVPTSSQTRSEYLGLYVDDIFPVGERYAYLVATFFVTFSFSGVLPILVPVSAIAFLLLYFSDKLLIFKFYQTPKNYTPHLHQFLINVLIFSLVSHFALTAYFLTEPTLVAQGSSVTSAAVTGNGRINTIITTVYVYPYLGLLVLIIVYFFLQLFCDSLFTFLQNCFCQKTDVLAREQSYIKQEINFWKILSKLQLDSLSQLSQYTLERYRLKQQGDINALISRPETNELAGTAYPVTIASQILQNAVAKLHKRATQYQEDKNLAFDLRTVLIGLPSYDFLIEKDKLSRNNLMVKIETQLKHYYRHRFSMAEQRSQMSPPRLQMQPPKHQPLMPDSSAAQLNPDSL